MIEISFNGEKEQLDSPCTVLALLKAKGFDSTKVAVAMNLELVPRGCFAESVIDSDCDIDVLAAVQGG